MRKSHLQREKETEAKLSFALLLIPVGGTTYVLLAIVLPLIREILANLPF